MLTVKGIELDFDITSPADMLKHKAASEALEKEEQNIKTPTSTPDTDEFLNEYIEMLNQELKIYGNFLDNVFGDGTAEKLLTNNPSLNKVTELFDEFGKAFEKQGLDFGAKIKKYQPNRATRRKQGK